MGKEKGAAVAVWEISCCSHCLFPVFSSAGPIRARLTSRHTRDTRTNWFVRVARCGSLPAWAAVDARACWACWALLWMWSGLDRHATLHYRDALNLYNIYWLRTFSRNL